MWTACCVGSVTMTIWLFDGSPGVMRARTWLHASFGTASLSFERFIVAFASTFAPPWQVSAQYFIAGTTFVLKVFTSLHVVTGPESTLASIFSNAMLMRASFTQL